MFDEILDGLKEEMIQALCESLCIRSDAQPPEAGKPNGEGVARALAHALEKAARLGFLTKEAEGQYGFAEYGQGEELIAVLGHLDVVPAGDGWSYPPFSGAIDNGKIFGRGALDNKGHVFAALYGLKAIMDSGVELPRRIRLIFGTCEETANFSDMARYAAEEELPVAGFTPDSDFPVIYAEKGVLHVTFSQAFAQDAGEDADVVMESLACGTVVNMVPDKAEATLRVNGHPVALQTRGVSAHGSRPGDGDNACFGMLALLSRQDLPVPMQDAFSFLAHALTEETSGANLGIAMRDEPSGPLTVNLGLLDAGPSYIRGRLDIRYPVTASKDEILSRLEESFAKGGFGIDALNHMEPLYRPVDDSLVETLVRVFAETTGITHAPIATGGGTYARSMPNLLAFGPCFPGGAYAFHQPDENIAIDHLVQLSKIYARAMYELAVKEGRS